MEQPRKTFSEIVEEHLPDDIYEPVKPKYQWSIVQEFSHNVRAFRDVVDLIDQAVYEKACKDYQAKKLKEAERSSSTDKLSG